MTKEEKKQVILAALAGDRQTVDEMTRPRTLYFQVDSDFYRSDLKTPLTKEVFESEFRTGGTDTLIQLGTNHSEQIKIMERFGHIPEQIADYIAEIPTPEETANEFLKLKNRFKNE
jgi:hypothetical protein